MKYKLDGSYRCLDRLEKWDEETQQEIKRRINHETGNEMKFNFLSEADGILLSAIIDALVFQPDEKQKVHIAQVIDESLSDEKNGVRYGEQPWKARLYQNGLIAVKKALESETYDRLSDASFKQAVVNVIEKIYEKEVGFEYSFVRKVLSDATSVYYSHPVAWDTIGFPGPAFPEGYAYLECGQADEWEPKFEVSESSFAKATKDK